MSQILQKLAKGEPRPAQAEFQALMNWIFPLQKLQTDFFGL
jgi:hypothetical protein